MLISKVSRGLDRLCIFLLIVTTTVMSVSLVIMIFGRNFFNMSFASLEEISRFTFVWLTFTGAAIAFKRKEHMGMDFVVSKLRGKTATVVEIIQDIVALILFALFIFYGIELAVLNIEVVSLQSGIPMGYVYFIIPVTGFIMVIHALDHIIKSIKRKHTESTNGKVVMDKVSSI
ncbi:TRAP transporter small permease [Oceanobacillus alkalisoli]|uniref:TRAP transporter small permease n=1 Tax=Oceanobacillus alkalisoli TaxID=2925113 RepID=UPI001EE44821|nr:TRAP transporter small permease [Oceanobacillus alkalisoli]MCG5102568.1 TRAP transporter small permease [Oceanobacillus alkalisoli]